MPVEVMIPRNRSRAGARASGRTQRPPAPGRFGPARRLAVSLLLAALVAGCANQLDSDSTRAALTGHQRDSVLAQSELPGAATVGRALDENDHAAERAAALDSVPR